MQTRTITIEVYGISDTFLSFALQDAIAHIEKGECVGCECEGKNAGFSFSVKKYEDKHLMH